MPWYPTLRRLAVSPGVGIAPETTPVKYVPSMLRIENSMWWNQKQSPYRATYREKSWWERQRWGAFTKSGRPVLQRKYSREALAMALEMIPEDFQVADVPRPPQRIRAQSEGIVGRWYSNYWTLHSIKYQCFLANLPCASSSGNGEGSEAKKAITGPSLQWRWGERDRPRTNYEEPHMFVDFEETKAIRDYRSRWININRSLVGMTKRMKEAEEEQRYMSFKRSQEQFWSNRRVFVNRVKSMSNQGTLTSSKDLPIKTFNIKAFLSEQ